MPLGKKFVMDGLQLLEHVIKIVRDRQQIVGEQLTGGSVPDFAVFRHLRGRYEELAVVESELRALRKKVAEADE